jgi:RecA/RadA recombinase
MFVNIGVEVLEKTHIYTLTYIFLTSELIALSEGTPAVAAATEIVGSEGSATAAAATVEVVGAEEAVAAAAREVSEDAAAAATLVQICNAPPPYNDSEPTPNLQSPSFTGIPPPSYAASQSMETARQVAEASGVSELEITALIARRAATVETSLAVRVITDSNASAGDIQLAMERAEIARDSAEFAQERAATSTMLTESPPSQGKYLFSGFIIIKKKAFLTGCRIR